MLATLPSSFIVIDFETPTRRPADGFVEVAIARVLDFKIAEEWASLANPGRTCDPGAEAVHKITAAAIAAAPLQAEIVAELVTWLIDGLPVVAYNGDTFDRIVLEQAAQAAGVTLPPLQWVDPLPVARALLRQRSHKLADVATSLGVAFAGADMHRAATDIAVLVEVVRKLRDLQMATRTTAAPPSVPAQAGQADDPAPFETTAAAPQIEPFGAPAGDSSPLVRDAMTALSPLASKVRSWIAKAKTLPCDTDDDEARVINAIATFKQLDREAEKDRKKWTDEIGRQKREIEAAWRRDVAKPIEAVIAELEALRRPLALRRAEAAAAEQRRMREEAEAIALAARAEAMAPALQANDAALEALLSGDTAGAMAHAGTAAAVIDNANDLADNVHAEVIARAAAVAPPPVRASMATATDRIVWRARILAPELVPARFCSPDLAKIQAYIAECSGDCAIPGVAFEADVETVTRARRGV